MLTHVHSDQVGWTMRDGSPFFPKARYVVEEAEYEWIAAEPADPGLAFVGEEEPEVAADWRRRLLPDLASSGKLVGFAHLGLGHVVSDSEGFRWQPSN